MSNLKSIKAAAEALQRATEARDKVASALGNLEAADDASSPAADLERIKADHADIAAAVALGERPAEDAKASAKTLETAARAVAAAKERAEASDATRAGLARRLADADTAVARAADALESARIEWLRTEAEAADVAYTEAARALWAAWTRHDSVRSALLSRGVSIHSSGRAPELMAIGEVSAAASLQVRPSNPHGFAEPMTPFYDPAAARVVLEAELSAAEQTAPAGLFGKARAALGRTNA
jgi:hypothetical protein